MGCSYHSGAAKGRQCKPTCKDETRERKYSQYENPAMTNRQVKEYSLNGPQASDNKSTY